jgi:UDP-N-acetylmuramyl pentapeptide phosphotransferase/UDP-N-acetylglucosamine-1-phosphate transferase
VVTAGLRRVLDARTGPGWRRLNYRGSTVTLSAGPAAVAGLLAGIAISGRRELTGAAVAVAGAGAAGCYDDWASVRADEQAAKGFAGHLRAAAQGKVSAGAVKVAVIGFSSLAGAFVRTGATADTVLDGCLVAGSANLCNLLDLRPGRALKVAALVTLASTPLARGSGAALLGASYGTLVAALPADLGERSMLGDTGANALGALLGCLLCRNSRRNRVRALVVVTGLTALSEKVSFTAVIETNPALRRLDELGRTVG